MKTLSDLFDPLYLRREKSLTDCESLEKFIKIPDVINEFLPTIEKGIGIPSLPVSESFRFLKIHAIGSLLFARCLFYSASGDIENAKKLFDEFLNYYREKELLIQNVFDVYEFCVTLSRKKYW